MPKLYSLNKQYFDQVDSLEKAYILGFIYADGGIACTNNVGYRLDFSQHRNGREVLEFIKTSLEYTGPILYDQPSKLKNKTFLRDRLQICSKYLVSNLISLGITPNKSLTITRPMFLQIEQIGSFIRGYFDGDGSAGLYSYKNYFVPMITFNGTEDILNWIKTEACLLQVLQPKGNIKRLSVGSQNEVKTLIELMRTSPFGMIRKTLVLEKLAAYCERSNMKTSNNGGTPADLDNPVAPIEICARETGKMQLNELVIQSALHV